MEYHKDLKGLNRTETLCHEMVHGMLLHMGYDELCNNEQFVQAMGNAICQGFDIKKVKVDDYIPDFVPLDHDGCKGCEYELVPEDDAPCSICKQRYYDKYKAKKVKING